MAASDYSGWEILWKILTGGGVAAGEFMRYFGGKKTRELEEKRLRESMAELEGMRDPALRGLREGIMAQVNPLISAGEEHLAARGLRGTGGRGIGMRQDILTGLGGKLGQAEADLEAQMRMARSGLLAGSIPNQMSPWEDIGSTVGLHSLGLSDLFDQPAGQTFNFPALDPNWQPRRGQEIKGGGGFYV